jgi:hypothetical protein
MRDIIVVTTANYINGHTLALTFSDGVKAEVDFSNWIEKYSFFEPLKDTNLGGGGSLDGWTVVWPNGADIAPETLHKIALKANQSQPA